MRRNIIRPTLHGITKAEKVKLIRKLEDGGITQTINPKDESRLQKLNVKDGTDYRLQKLLKRDKKIELLKDNVCQIPAFQSENS